MTALDSRDDDIQRILGALELNPRLAATTGCVWRCQVFHDEAFVTRLACFRERGFDVRVSLGALHWCELDGSKGFQTAPALGVGLIDDERIILCQNVEDGERHRNC